jgi:hypothetical protein
MRINVRRFGDRWILTQQGGWAPGYFNVLGDALDEAALRFRSAVRGGSATFSISYGRLANDEAHGLRLAAAGGEPRSPGRWKAARSRRYDGTG